MHLFTGQNYPPVHFVWNIVDYGLMLVCLFAFFQSLFRYRNIIVAFLSIITLLIQVFAYGFGLLWGGWNALLGKEVKGFSKNYYGNKKS